MLLSTLRYSVQAVIWVCGLILFFQSCDFSGNVHETPDSLILTDQNFDVLKDPQTFTIKEELGEKMVTVLGKNRSVRTMLTSFYSPDSFTQANVSADSSPDYIITGVQLIQGTFLSDSGACEQRTMLLCTRGDFVEEEYYDLFFIARDQKGEAIVSGKEIFEGSHGASSIQLEVNELSLPVRKDCSLLMVTSKDENADADFHKESWMEIFIATGKGFRSLFRLQLEETAIADYVASEEETQHSVSKIQRYEMLDTSSNGLHDIRVKYTVTEDGRVVKQGENVYRFDGRYYVLS